MTGMELSTCARYGLDPIVIVLNNGGYTTERLILDGAFNDIQRWDYSKLPEVIGAGRAHRVETVGDLDRALADARRRDGQFVLLDVRLDKLDVSPALRRLGASLQQAAAHEPATGKRKRRTRSSVTSRTYTACSEKRAGSSGQALDFLLMIH